jgi:hypothetical protein
MLLYGYSGSRAGNGHVTAPSWMEQPIDAAADRRWRCSHNHRVPSSEAAPVHQNAPHHQRQAAESFGSDPER